MKKQLSEMTLEELWELFPIVLKEHNEEYASWYEAERLQLLKYLHKDDVKRLSHIGSSAVKGLIAKPTIDILLEIDGCCNITQLIDDLQSDNWNLMLKRFEPTMEIAFCKGYNSSGFAEKIYHLHVRYFGDWSELYFRDYLRVHSDVASEYEKLKLNLEKDFKYNRDGYTDAKSDFVLKHSNIAKQEFSEKYKPK